MDNLKEQLQKAINDIDFNNLCENHKDTIEKALVMLQVKWEVYGVAENAINIKQTYTRYNIEVSYQQCYQPEWNWFSHRYHIVPQKKLVPFDNSDAEYLKGKLVKKKNEDYVGIISCCTDDDVRINGTSRLATYLYFLKQYTFLDGSPCGKEV